VVLENDLCLYLRREEVVLPGSGIIIPKAHRETVFDLTSEEWAATFDLLQQVKSAVDEVYAPQGHSVGWNVGEVGGQEIFHAHLHVIPRFEDEPYAGRGIRYWLKQETNRRPS
jgi:histidine triad (HIT) family protein